MRSVERSFDDWDVLYERPLRETSLKRLRCSMCRVPPFQYSIPADFALMVHCRSP
jgi:hypothetical protein